MAEDLDNQIEYLRTANAGATGEMIAAKRGVISACAKNLNGGVFLFDFF